VKVNFSPSFSMCWTVDPTSSRLLMGSLTPKQRGQTTQGSPPVSARLSFVVRRTTVGTVFTLYLS
jgi:hypothetical protein